jgi:CBS domain-containing protein
VSLSAQALLDVNVFFDFRGAYGDENLVMDLRRHLDGLLATERPEFFFHLAQSTLQFKPPVGLFGRIQTESADGDREALNLKSALVPVVNFARIYSLKHRVAALNSLERLHRLRDLGVLLPSSHEELAQDFGVLSDMRLRHQVAQWRRGLAPDNHVNLEELTHLDETLLRRIFADIGVFQARLQTDFARTS